MAMPKLADRGFRRGAVPVAEGDRGIELVDEDACTEGDQLAPAALDRLCHAGCRRIENRREQDGREPLIEGQPEAAHRIEPGQCLARSLFGPS